MPTAAKIGISINLFEQKCYNSNVDQLSKQQPIQLKYWQLAVGFDIILTLRTPSHTPPQDQSGTLLRGGGTSTLDYVRQLF